ncbi:MAG TPA: siderophore-interacting protein [Pseudonocardiaceae bacterium]|jgi:NADPH-dependent ferric siderophore reductase|nr:siderophore-interacting protein [Pseudonocardiaceae bacterium]
MTTGITALPFRIFDLRVLRVARLSPSFIRITFGGADVADVRCGGRDQRVKLFLPHPGQDTPVLPDDRDGDWFGQWRAMDPATRAVMRTYTVREHRKDSSELDIDFAVHGSGGGAASQWALEVGVGSRVALLAPVNEDNGAVDFRPPPDTDWVLLTADETAVPAVEAILSWLPATMRARVWLEVARAQDIRELPTEAQAEITWLIREAENGKPDEVLSAVRGARLPSGKPYAWIAGEAADVRELRRHLLRERGFERDAVVFTGYWRRGAGEDDVLAERLSDGAPDQD